MTTRCLGARDLRSLSANILSPDEDFIIYSLWNGLMNFEVVIHLGKKIDCTLHTVRDEI